MNRHYHILPWSARLNLTENKDYNVCNWGSIYILLDLEPEAIWFLILQSGLCIRTNGCLETRALQVCFTFKEMNMTPFTISIISRECQQIEGCDCFGYRSLHNQTTMTLVCYDKKKPHCLRIMSVFRTQGGWNSYRKKLEEQHACGLHVNEISYKAELQKES